MPAVELVQRETGLIFSTMRMFRRTCREVTRLVLEGEERRLGWVDRTAIRLHLMVCEACPRFMRQVEFMRHAMGRWRNYRDAE